MDEISKLRKDLDISIAHAAGLDRFIKNLQRQLEDTERENLKLRKYGYGTQDGISPKGNN